MLPFMVALILMLVIIHIVYSFLFIKNIIYERLSKLFKNSETKGQRYSK